MLRERHPCTAPDWIIAYVNREKLNRSQHLTLRYETQCGTFNTTTKIASVNDLALRYVPPTLQTLRYNTLRYVLSVNQPLVRFHQNHHSQPFSFLGEDAEQAVNLELGVHGSCHDLMQLV